jgi:hypothetical protein
MGIDIYIGFSPPFICSVAQWSLAFKELLFTVHSRLILGRFVLSRLFSRYIRGFHISIVSNAIHRNFGSLIFYFDTFSKTKKNIGVQSPDINFSREILSVPTSTFYYLNIKLFKFLQVS